MSDHGSSYDRSAARFNGRIGSMAGGMAVAFLATAAAWAAIFFVVTQLAGMEEPVARLAFALKCMVIAVLFCFLSGIEAVSHERLQTGAFDPLAGRDSQRLKINALYLQNTLEQLILFAPGLLGLALYSRNGMEMKAVVAATAVWIVARAAFWIGYHLGPQYRVFGLTGMMQSMLILLYVSARFGYELGGPSGAAAPIIVFIVVEALLVVATRGHMPAGDA